MPEANEFLPPGSSLSGTLIGLGANIAGSIVLGMSGLGNMVFGIGLSQLIWLIPMFRHYSRMEATETAKGIVIAGAITFLLNAGCWGILLINPPSFH
jgi:hypothetical protein